MRHECSNCKHFMTEVMQGDGRALDPIGDCVKLRKSFVTSDDWCNSYEMAKWAKSASDAKGDR